MGDTIGLPLARSRTTTIEIPLTGSLAPELSFIEWRLPRDKVLGGQLCHRGQDPGSATPLVRCLEPLA
jgi:hypothetical protein